MYQRNQDHPAAKKANHEAEITQDHDIHLGLIGQEIHQDHEKRGPGKLGVKITLQSLHSMLFWSRKSW